MKIDVSFTAGELKAGAALASFGIKALMLERDPEYKFTEEEIATDATMMEWLKENRLSIVAFSLKLGQASEKINDKMLDEIIDEIHDEKKSH